jgi:hypothetical protein
MIFHTAKTRTGQERCEKLVKIGVRIVRHSRYVVFQLAEVAVPRALVRRDPAPDRSAQAESAAAPGMSIESNTLMAARPERCGL